MGKSNIIKNIGHTSTRFFFFSYFSAKFFVIVFLYFLLKQNIVSDKVVAGNLQADAFSSNVFPYFSLKLFHSKADMMMIWCFTPLSTLFTSYRDDGRMIMKGYVQ